MDNIIKDKEEKKLTHPRGLQNFFKGQEVNTLDFSGLQTKSCILCTYLLVYNNHLKYNHLKCKKYSSQAVKKPVVSHM